MATLATLNTWLEEAETAYHQLQTGSKAEELHHGPKKVIYTPANQSELRQYISELKGQIATASGARRKKPIYLS